MTERATWRLDAPITRVTEVISIERHGEEMLRQEITRLGGQLGQRADDHLTEAANAWTNAREKLEDLQDTLREAGDQLAQAWTALASAESQHALMLLHDGARDLANTAHQVSDFTGTAAQLMHTLLDHAPSGADPGRLETVTGNVGAFYGQHSLLGLVPGIDSSTLADAGRTVYEVPGRVLDSVAGGLGIGGDRTAEYQAAVHALNEQYVAESWRLPARITSELPQIAGQRTSLGDAASGVGDGSWPSPGEPLASDAVPLPPSGPGRGAAEPDVPTDRVESPGGLAGVGGGPGWNAAGPGPGAGPAAGSGIGGQGGPSVGGPGAIGPSGSQVRRGAEGMPRTGTGSARGAGGRTRSPTGQSGAARSGARSTGGKGGPTGVLPASAGTGRGSEAGPGSRQTWLVEDDPPWGADDDDPPTPAGVVR